jgi:DNA-damage-inducible protein D
VSDDASSSKKIADVAFRASLDRPQEDQEATQSKLSDSSIDSLIEQFEEASQTDDDGVEYWYARDLQKLLGYLEYRNFQPVIAKAIAACRNTDQPVENHFVHVHEMVEIGSNAERQISDYKLTRYASYLIAQNGDSRKKPIAFAQTYFAIQTRKQEVQDNETKQFMPLSEDERRLLLRDEIKTHNKTWQVPRKMLA